jgi:hypothetical protein
MLIRVSVIRQRLPNVRLLYMAEWDSTCRSYAIGVAGAGEAVGGYCFRLGTRVPLGFHRFKVCI